MGYGYQYIPHEHDAESRAPAESRGFPRVHMLEGTSLAATEAIAEIYRDIASVRSATVELAPLREGEVALETAAAD